MSFHLYAKSSDAFEEIAPLKLTGANGILARFLHSNATEDTPFTWQLTAREIITLHDKALDPDSCEIVIDMLPESFTEVCLYRLTHLQGSSDFDESDVVLATKILFQGSTPTNAQQFKKSFVTQSEIRDSRQMLEALRLTGGTERGTYFWAKPKMDIGAAVCPAARKEALV